MRITARTEDLTEGSIPECRTDPKAVNVLPADPAGDRVRIRDRPDRARVTGRDSAGLNGPADPNGRALKVNPVLRRDPDRDKDKDPGGAVRVRLPQARFRKAKALQNEVSRQKSRPTLARKKSLKWRKNSSKQRKK